MINIFNTPVKFLFYLYNNVIFHITDQNLLFLVGGRDDGASFKVEILDISGMNRTCPNLPDYDYNEGAVGNFVDGEVLVCGGFTNYDGDCYNFNASSNNWIKQDLLQHQDGIPNFYEVLH